METKQKLIHDAVQKYLMLNCAAFTDGSLYPSFLAIIDTLTVSQIEDLFKSTKQPFLILNEAGEFEKFGGLKKGLQAHEGFLTDEQTGMLQDLGLVEGEMVLLLGKIKLALGEIESVMEKVFAEIEQSHEVPADKLAKVKETFTIKLTKATEEKIRTMKLAQLREEFYETSLSADKIKELATKSLGIST